MKKLLIVVLILLFPVISFALQLPEYATREFDASKSRKTTSV